MRGGRILATMLAAMLLMAEGPHNRAQVVVNVHANGAITITKNGKPITCGQLRAMFHHPGMPRQGEWSCKSLNDSTAAITRYDANLIRHGQ
jgi:hypothetical protein